MIEIVAANENAIVSQSVGDGVHKDSCPGKIVRSNSLPSLEALSISTNNIRDNCNNDIAVDIGNDLDDSCSYDFNDCSSSVSSQDSSNIRSESITRISSKRSVFSQYWRKTGQKPVPMRPLISLSTSDLLRRSPYTLQSPQTQEVETVASSWNVKGSNWDRNSSSTSLNSNSSSVDLHLDRALLKSFSNAELLEDNVCDEYTEGSASQSPPSRPQSHLESQSPSSSQSQSPTTPSTPRRRSILPPAPMSHPALKSTLRMQQRSWRKSVSLSSVNEYSCSNYYNNYSLGASPKTRSMPRMRSSSSILQPGASCLRPTQKYSPCRPDVSSRKKMAPPLSLSIPPLPSQLQSPSPLQLPTTESSGSASSSQLSRCGSSSTVSSVSFLEAVDVQHFEPPRETYSGKGWSEYFK